MTNGQPNVDGAETPGVVPPPALSWRRIFAVQDDPNYVLASYRYLRLAIPVVIITLFVSLFLERAHTTCWNDSVSAYYYTPVHSVFVATLGVIGVALFVIRGATLFEEILLNMSAVLAPVVAFIPTSWSNHDCPSNLNTPSQIKFLDNHLGGNHFFADFSANNLTALIIGGIVAVVLTSLLTIANRQTAPSAASRVEKWIPLEVLVPAIGGVLVIATGIIWQQTWPANFNTHAHGYAAVTMFVLVGIVIFSTAWRLHKARSGWAYPYFASVGLMLVGGVGVYVAGAIISWRHQTLILEAIEVIAFAFFWLIRTIELWSNPSGLATAVADP